MVLRYRSLLRRPMAARLVLSGGLARLPIATYGIGLLALVRERYGSFEVAGGVTAAYGAAAVLSGLVLGRWADRRWFPRLLVVVTVLDVVDLLGLLVSSVAHRQLWLVLVLAIGLGLLLPPATVVVRSRWAAMLTSPAELDSAFFLESGLDELVFVIGPVLVVGVGAALSPEAALLVAGAATTLGGLGLAGLKSAARAAAAPELSEGRPPFSRPTGPDWAQVRLYAGFAALGTTFAAIQVSVFAITRAVGAPGSAGLVLGVFSLISLTASWLAGSRAPTLPLRLGLALLGAALLAPALVSPPTVASLTLMLVPAAGTASPSVALGFAQAARLVTEDRRPAVFAWCGAGLGTGLAAGSLGSGVVAEHAGGSGVLLVAAMVALTAAAIAPPLGLARAADKPRDCTDGAGVAAFRTAR
jgi:hypothetical protein